MLPEIMRNSLPHSSFARPDEADSPPLRAQAHPAFRRGLQNRFAYGNGPGSWSHPAQAVEAGSDYRVTGINSTPSRVHLQCPTAVCFLFDTAFLWRSGYGKVTAEAYACSARFTKRMPRKIRYACPHACQGRPALATGQSHLRMVRTLVATDQGSYLRSRLRGAKFLAGGYLVPQRNSGAVWVVLGRA